METSRWSWCPGSCGEGSGVMTKTSLNLHHCPRYQLIQPVVFENIKKHHFVLSRCFFWGFFCLQAAIKAGLSDSEIKEALTLSTSKEIKDKLKSATQDALDHGVSCPSVLLVDSGKRDKTL